MIIVVKILRVMITHIQTTLKCLKFSNRDNIIHTLLGLITQYHIYLTKLKYIKYTFFPTMIYVKINVTFDNAPEFQFFLHRSYMGERKIIELVAIVITLFEDVFTLLLIETFDTCIIDNPSDLHMLLYVFSLDIPII